MAARVILIRDHVLCNLFDENNILDRLFADTNQCDPIMHFLCELFSQVFEVIFNLYMNRNLYCVRSSNNIGNTCYLKKINTYKNEKKRNHIFLTILKNRIYKRNFFDDECFQVWKTVGAYLSGGMNEKRWENIAVKSLILKINPQISRFPKR